MTGEPPAIVEQRPESEHDFRRWVRDELKHTREQLGRIGTTLDLLLKMAEQDEKRHEADHG